MTEPTDIDQAAFQLQEAKNRAALVREEVIHAEQKLIDLIGVADDRTTSQKGRFYTVKTVGKINRRIDIAALEQIKQTVPQAILAKAIALKPAIDLKGLRYLEQNEPAYYNEVSRAVIAKPAKTAVSVELLGGDE